MCNRKKLKSTLNEGGMNSDSDNDVDMISSDDGSDFSTTSSSDGSDISEQIENSESDEGSDYDLNETANIPEDEDDTIKAIQRECNRQRECPPTIQSEDFVTDICFHPGKNILAVANVVGDVVLYEYTNQENFLLNTLELHTKACRDIEFSDDGTILFSTSKDKSIMLSDVETGKLVHFYEKAHDVPIYCLTVIDEYSFATGKMEQIWYCF